MGTYMFQGSYTAEGKRGLLTQGGTGRRAAVEKLCAAEGGKLLSFYFTLGADDFAITVELPDDETAAAAALHLGEGGTVGLRTTVLLTCEQADGFVQRVHDHRARHA
jgi:uncharacterized protein with GYD domain